MFPHLMGMKEYNHLSSEDMGAMIGTSRQTYENKMARGNFTPRECKIYCRRFGQSFEYLFATIEELNGANTAPDFMTGAEDGPEDAQESEEAQKEAV